MDKIKLPNDGKEPDRIKFDNQELWNQQYIDDLVKIIKTVSVIPTHTPKKFIECFCFYYNNDTTYRLYIYINNEWKYTNLS